MSEVFAAASQIFSWLFVTTTGTNAHTAAVVQLINLITGNDFLLLGLGLMIAGAVCSYLARLIHTS